MPTIEYNQGARQSYGPSDVETRNPATYSTFGVREQIVVPLNYDDLPAATTQDETVVVIPANALITGSYLYVSEDFDSTSGTTTVDVGLQEADGTEIDNDGIDVDVITADGSNAGWTVNDGALVGATIGDTDGYVVLTPSTADLTAGKGILVIEYIEVPVK